MGFDLARFIDEVDEEFQCSICKMVLENPVQTPCDHLFCSECIKNWLSVDRSCPVDRQSLAKTDLKPINRSLRNLLNKLEIKCDFDSQGCNAIGKLDGLEGHIANCEYNPNARIVCDKGCNLEMSRREYQTSNCLTHLSINHRKEIAALTQELSNQKEHFDRLVHRQGEEIGRLSNEVIQLRHEKNQLIDLQRVTNRQEKEIKNLSEEVHQLRRHQKQFGTSTQRQGIANRNDEARIILTKVSCNIKSYLDQPDILELDDESRWGHMRSFQELEPNHSSFKVQVLSGGDFYVGLSFRGETTEFGEWFALYNGLGSLFINGVIEYRGSKCKIRDIIELGIRFKSNYLNDGNASVDLYLSINEQVVKEKVLKMPYDEIYPTIQILCKKTKIKYFGI